MSAEGTEDNQFRSANSLIGDPIESKEGEVCGKCADFLFDEENWTIRYIVADTGGFLSHHRVLLSPFVFENPKFGGHDEHMSTVLSKDWIESAPALDADAPISRQYELEMARHYDHPLYWAGAELWGLAPYPGAEIPDPDEAERHTAKMDEIREGHLRSCSELEGYRVLSQGEELGVVEDFVVQTEPWRIRYLVVDTGDWLDDRKIILSPEWAETISWKERQVTMTDLARARVEGAPEFDPAEGVNRDYEGHLYDYYGRPCYW